MNTKMILATGLLGAGALYASLNAFGADPQGDRRAVPTPDTSASAVDVLDVLFAQPFTLDPENAYAHEWQAEQPQVSAGYLVALEVNRDFVEPTQGPAPVLYAGNQIPERINYGHESGVLLVVIPSELDAQGRPVLDLASTPIWFGAPGIPDQTTQDDIDAALERALARGVTPLGEATLEAAFSKADGPLAVSDRTELHMAAAHLILEYAPQEREFAEGMLAPLIR